MIADRRRRGRVVRKARRRDNRAITRDRRASAVSVELYLETGLFERGIREAAERFSACSGTPFGQLAQALRIFAEAVAEQPTPRPRQLLHNGRKP